MNDRDAVHGDFDYILSKAFERDELSSILNIENSQFDDESKLDSLLEVNVARQSHLRSDNKKERLDSIELFSYYNFGKPDNKMVGKDHIPSSTFDFTI